MTDTDYARIRSIRDFETLVEYLRDELDWPLDMEIDDVDDLAFEYEPDELGLDKGYEVKVREVKQLRPASSNQPWGIFYVDFETKRLPIVVLRRALRALVPRKRASAAASHQATWDADDLLFIAATGEAGNRGISFAHFEKNEGGQPRLKTVTWDEQETHFFYLKQNIARLRWPESESDTTAWRAGWASAFPTEHREVIKTSKELSAELARLARSTRDMIRRVYDYEAKDGALHKLHESFKTVLIEDLDVNGFSDMVAQTISYGLFSARATGDRVLGLAHLERMVPNTNPFLKELFAEFVSMSGHEKHQIDFDELGVSDLVDMLNEVNVEAVLQDFGKQTGGGTQDPVIYFYEDFLKDYDKAQKVKRGEFYTPKPVVSYIVRSVDRVLRDELDCPDGLADTSEMEWNGETWPKVMILDPATGTGTFLETVIEVIYETMTEKWEKEGKKQVEIHVAWNEYVPKHLLPRLHGFELMMAPYSVAHMKLGLKLKETGYEFESDERLRVFLTNTLEKPREFSERLFAEFLAHEAESANNIKSGTPITVIIGNPPYAQYSANLSDEAKSYIEKYRYANGKRIKARNALQLERNLNDDYVKFFGWSTEQVIKDFSVIGLITNRVFLESESLVGLRQYLVDHFRRAAILDLHGSMEDARRIKRLSGDKNVFDILQGVAISLLWSKSNEQHTNKAVDSGELIGAEEYKMATLKESTYQDLSPLRILPNKPSWWLTREHHGSLDNSSMLTDILPEYATLTASNRDSFVVDFEADALLERIEKFRSFTGSNEELCQEFGITYKKGWNLSSARQKLRQVSDLSAFLQEIEYRPFDKRLIFFFPDLIWQMSPITSANIVDRSSNLVLISLGKNRDECTNGRWISDSLADKSVVSSRDNASGFPLYLYARDGDSLDRGWLIERTRQRLLRSGDLEVSELSSKLERLQELAAHFYPKRRYSRLPNMDLTFLADCEQALRLDWVAESGGNLSDTFGPEDLIRYIYALTSAPSYRERYAESLSARFPSIPITSDLSLFSELCGLGEQLVALHLMRSPLLDDLFSTFPKSGSNLMEKAKYDAEENRVYINKEGQYFDNVPEETWNFRIGGYQVLDKWLKDRRGRILSDEDIEHYTKVVKALHETARIMGEIDEVIEAHGGWPLAGSVKDDNELAMGEDAR